MKTKIGPLALAGALCLLRPAPARAMEIPLEGFGKSTKVAYVNMHKIFEAFPETEKARAELAAMIDEKKAEITAKKEEIAQLKGQIQFLKRQMFAVEPSTQPKTPEPRKEPQKDQAQEPSYNPLKEMSYDQMSSGDRPAPAAPQSETGLVLPEGSPLGFLFSPPSESTAAAETSTATAVSPFATKISTDAPLILPGIPSPAPQLGEKEALLSRKEADLEAFVGVAEQEIKQMEEGRTMTLLARIYKGVEEIAGKEGYSVIVDKSSILYGETAIDITEQVLYRLSVPQFKGIGK